MVKIVNLWSCPRCMSTSLMYAFSRHPQVAAVLDEPLYAHYLRVSGASRPYTDLVMQSQCSDGDQVVQESLSVQSPRWAGFDDDKVVFVKHITKMVSGLSEQSLRSLFPPQSSKTSEAGQQRVYHILLVRDPLSILQSWETVLGTASIQETGLMDSFKLYCDLVSQHPNNPPLIIRSDLLQREPAAILEKVCKYLSIEWDQKMLTWPAGPKPFDGVWAPW